MKLSLLIAGVLALGVSVSGTYRTPYGYPYYTSPYPAGSTAVYPAGTSVNYPAGTPLTYPAGANVVYPAPTTVTYPSQTTVYTPNGPVTYASNTQVQYPANSQVVYPPGTNVTTADNTTTTYNPINGNPYGIVTYPAPTNAGYYNTAYPPHYYPPGSPQSQYYQPGATTIYGPSPPPVGYSQLYYSNQGPYYATCTGYQSTGYPNYRYSNYYG